MNNLIYNYANSILLVIEVDISLIQRFDNIELLLTFLQNIDGSLLDYNWLEFASYQRDQYVAN